MSRVKQHDCGGEPQTHLSRHLKHVSLSSHPRLHLGLVTPVIFLFVPDEEDEGAHKSCSLFHRTHFILQGHPVRHGSTTRAEPGDLWLAVGH